MRSTPAGLRCTKRQRPVSVSNYASGSVSPAGLGAIRSALRLELQIALGDEIARTSATAAPFVCLRLSKSS